jgi:hypothetical protein
MIKSAICLYESVMMKFTKHVNFTAVNSARGSRVQDPVSTKSKSKQQTQNHKAS